MSEKLRVLLDNVTLVPNVELYLVLQTTGEQKGALLLTFFDKGRRVDEFVFGLMSEHLFPQELSIELNKLIVSRLWQDIKTFIDRLAEDALNKYGYLTIFVQNGQLMYCIQIEQWSWTGIVPKPIAEKYFIF